MTQPGRPKAVIDWAVVGKLLEAGCAGTDIASQLGIGVDTLERRCRTDNKVTFSAFSQQKRMSGDNLLRAAQYKAAMEGNTTMLVWLGKQRLGQVDRREHTGRNGDPIEIVAMTRDQYDSLTK
ncbi:MAG: hypothetical protein IPN27_11720 [Cellvibrionales bacterium]|nr:hypothetical protein [Cellvibrionales bacterium]